MDYLLNIPVNLIYKLLVLSSLFALVIISMLIGFLVGLLQKYFFYKDVKSFVIESKKEIDVYAGKVYQEVQYKCSVMVNDVLNQIADSIDDESLNKLHKTQDDGSFIN